MTTTINRQALYGVGVIAFLGCLYFLGDFPFGLSACERIANTWQESFGCRSRINDEGRVVQLIVSSADFGDSECRQLAEMPALEVVDLSGTGVTDSSLSVLAQLPALRTLKLAGTAVTDEGLGVLAGCQSLREISLCRCALDRLTESGVGQLRSLQSLNLMDTQISDDSGPALSRLVNLKQLYLGRSQISSTILSTLTRLKKMELLNVTGLVVEESAHLSALGELPSLQMLYLDHSGIDDNSFEKLTAAFADSDECTIAALFVEGCAISDASHEALMKLTQLPSLIKLRLTGTRVSRRVFNELVEAAPDISFAHGNTQAED